jgi:hypothetical protein
MVLANSLAQSQWQDEKHDFSQAMILACWLSVFNTFPCSSYLRLAISCLENTLETLGFVRSQFLNIKFRQFLRNVIPR